VKIRGKKMIKDDLDMIKDMVDLKFKKNQNEIIRLTEQLSATRDELFTFKKQMITTIEVASKEMMRTTESARIKLREESTQIFENALFMEKTKQFLIRTIEQEVKVILSKKGLTNVVKHKIEDLTKDRFDEFVEMVVDKIVNSSLKKARYENKLIKDLVSSTSYEIRRICRDVNVGYSYEEEVREAVINLIKKNSDKYIEKLIDSQNIKKIEVIE